MLYFRLQLCTLVKAACMDTTLLLSKRQAKNPASWMLPCALRPIFKDQKEKHLQTVLYLLHTWSHTQDFALKKNDQKKSCQPILLIVPEWLSNLQDFRTWSLMVLHLVWGQCNKSTYWQIKTQHPGIVKLIRTFTSWASMLLAPGATITLSCLVARPDNL